MATPVHTEPSSRALDGGTTLVDRTVGPIVCAVDGSECSARALRVAGELSRKLETGLIAVTVSSPPAVIGTGQARSRLRGQTLQHSRRLVEDTIVAAGCQRIATGTVRVGHPVEELTRVIGELGAELIVIGSRGRGVLKGLLLGSVGQDLVRESSRPVMVVPPNARVPGGNGRSGLNVICGVDDSDQALAAAAWVGQLVSRAGGEVVLAHVRTLNSAATYSHGPVNEAALRSYEERWVVKLLGRAADTLDPGVNGRLTVAAGDPATCLEQIAHGEDADLIAVGCRGRGPVGALMGSTSTALMASARRPVLIAK